MHGSRIIQVPGRGALDFTQTNRIVYHTMEGQQFKFLEYNDEVAGEVFMERYGVLRVDFNRIVKELEEVGYIQENQLRDDLIIMVKKNKTMKV